MSTTGRKIIQSLTEFTQHQKDQPVARTKRLPCGRTKAELRKMKTKLQKLIEITEAAERGEVIEWESRTCGWQVEDHFDAVLAANLLYRIAKPKRGAK